MAYYLGRDGGIDKDLPDGIYLSMPDDVYFALDRLGSTDFMRLCRSCPEDWWSGSRHNPNREEPERDEDYLIGKGLHSYVLESSSAFFALYERCPQKDYSSPAAKEWRAATKRDKKIPLSQRSYAAVIQMGELILNHPQLKKMFANPPGMITGMSELVVLFTFMGLKVRVKFDRLMVGYCIDLKTAGNHKQLWSDEATVVDTIVKMRYSVQRYFYSVGRAAMADLLERGMVFNADADEREWLQKVADRGVFDWLFIFVKKMSNSGKNPSATVVTPVQLPFGDATYERGRQLCETAVNNYKKLVTRWGLNTPWARINPIIVPGDQMFIDEFMKRHNQDAVPETQEDEENED